jgi:hypothetical protein
MRNMSPSAGPAVTGPVGVSISILAPDRLVAGEAVEIDGKRSASARPRASASTARRAA